MSQTLHTLGAVALGALLVGAAALTVRPSPVAGAPAIGIDPTPHTITVSASGKVSLVPDVARLNLGVTITRPTVKAARAAAASAMTNIIATVKAEGVAENDIQTVGLSLYPQYARGSSTKIVGYTIGNQVQITVRDLDSAGDVVDAAMARGVTEMNGISFEVSDPARAQNDARVSAIAAAEASARAMAAAAHVTLGPVVAISDATPYTPIAYPYARAAALSDLATPIQAGTQDVTVTVTVVFEVD